jgi:hypothetical protein
MSVEDIVRQVETLTNCGCQNDEPGPMILNEFSHLSQ